MSQNGIEILKINISNQSKIIKNQSKVSRKGELAGKLGRWELWGDRKWDCFVANEGAKVGGWANADWSQGSVWHGCGKMLYEKGKGKAKAKAKVNETSVEDR